MVDAMIRLFESTATSFLSNGLGSLPDASKCEVVEERNGSYELELEYHLSGKRYAQLELRRILVVKPNPYAKPQPFRIYDISKPINGLVTVKAEHISYDMSGIPVLAFTASGATEAFEKLKDFSLVECPFLFSTDVSRSGELKVQKPISMRSLLGGTSGSILDVYGGEYEFDGYRTILHASRGSNRGVSIRYGKNMTDLKQEENCSNVYTAVYPFWYSEEWGLIDLPEKTIATPGTHGMTRVYPLDLSSEWENFYEWEDLYPSEDEIRDLANAYISEHKMGVPNVSLTVSFEQLSQTGEYAMLELLESVQLCDIVNIEFPELKVDATAKCIKTTYNVLTGKYTAIELGEARSNLTSAMVSKDNIVDEKINERPTKTEMEQVVEKATLSASGKLGGYVVMRSSEGGDHPDEILVMDTPDVNTATKVWRWNRGGLGYSANGYGGPYTTAITQDGEIVADFVKTGHLRADLIQGGALTVGGIQNTNGTIEVRDSTGSLLIRLGVNGIEFYGNGGSTVTRIVNDTLKTTNVVATNLQVTAANITGTLTANQINANGLVAESFRYVDEKYRCEVSDGIEIFEKTDESTSYSIRGANGSMTLSGFELMFYSGSNYNGVSGSIWFDGSIFHVSKPLSIGTGSIRAGSDGTAAIVDYAGNGQVCFGVSNENADQSASTILRGKVVRIYSRDNAAVYLGSSGSVAVTSDERLKEICELDSRYETFFMELHPILYVYKEHGHRKHIGYGAREVEKALLKSGLTTEEFAGLLIDRNVTMGADEMGTEEDVFFEDLYSLRYEEFGALYAYMLQKAYRRIEEQRQEIEELKMQLKEVLTYIRKGE